MTFSSTFFSTLVVLAILVAGLAAVVLPILFLRDARRRSLW